MVFLQAQRLNYTNAVLECANMTGVLADVLGESRTDAYTQLLMGAGVEVAFVGVRSDNGSEFVSVSGE